MRMLRNTRDIDMVKFFLGFACAIVSIAIIWIVNAFQLFQDPLPISGDQFRQEWTDTVRDSAGHWVLTNMTSDGFVIELQYPTKKYKFGINKNEITINRPIDRIPMNLQSGDVALSIDPLHPLVR
jgi:hypothetical protein